MTGKTVRALVLAGARETGDPLCRSEGVASKAILDINGKPMVAHVVDALRAAGMSEPIWMLGGEPEALGAAIPDLEFTHLEAKGAGPAGSLAIVLDGQVDTPLLVTTADHPLLRAEIVSQFVRAAEASAADLCVGFAQRVTIEARFPETRRTYLPIGKKDLSSCNLFYLSNDMAKNVLSIWQTLEAERKKPWRMARRLGLWFLVRLFLARGSSERVFRLLSQRLGARICPVILPFAEAAVDVDTPEDLELVRGILAKPGS